MATVSGGAAQEILPLVYDYLKNGYKSVAEALKRATNMVRHESELAIHIAHGRKPRVLGCPVYKGCNTCFLVM